MTDVGFLTLPRGGRGGGGGGGEGGGGRVANRSAAPQPNGHAGAPLPPAAGTALTMMPPPSAPPPDYNTAVHDGFATIRSGGSKRLRARSSPAVGVAPPVPTDGRSCPGCVSCIVPGSRSGGFGGMEPLWEERGTKGTQGSGAPITRRDRSVPWWEVATRRSRYRSCPAFTQASMVTALEQTMSSVTDKLDRLASSPDLKESELAELRRTMEVLRQQSTAVCQSVSSGYFSLERQMSCDSVSSVTSTISGASLSSFASMNSRANCGNMPLHHTCQLPLSHGHQEDNSSDGQSKMKKRSWLRSSFRRAFGRHGRKRSKQGGRGVDGEERIEDGVGGGGGGGGRGRSCTLPHELPVNHTANITAVRSLTAPPSTPMPGRESEVISQLRQELAEKERALTDARLELLNAQHQLQTRADATSKLKAEIATLREENVRLSGLVRAQYGPAADGLITPLAHALNSTLTLNPFSHTGSQLSSPSAGGEGRRVRVLVVDSIGMHDHSRIPSSPPPPYHQHFPSSSKPDDPANTPTEDDAATTSSDETLQLGESEGAGEAGREGAAFSSGRGGAVLVGNIHVPSKTTWDDLDDLVASAVRDYAWRVDPSGGLGVATDVVLCYRVDETLRTPGGERPELLPCGYFVGDVDCVHVWLKGAQQRDADEDILSTTATTTTSTTTTTLSSSSTYSTYNTNNFGRVDALAFTMTSPRALIGRYIAQLFETRRLLIAGSAKTGKSHLALRLAQFYVVSSGRQLTDDTIVTFNVSSSNTLDLCHLLSSLWPRGGHPSPRIPNSSSSSSSSSSLRSTSSSTTSITSASSTQSSGSSTTTATLPPLVLIIEDLHAAGGVIETLQRYLPASSPGGLGPAVIATSRPAPALATRLQLHSNFRCAMLSASQEPN